MRHCVIPNGGDQTRHNGRMRRLLSALVLAAVLLFLWTVPAPKAPGPDSEPNGRMEIMATEAASSTHDPARLNILIDGECDGRQTTDTNVDIDALFDRAGDSEKALTAALAVLANSQDPSELTATALIDGSDDDPLRRKLARIDQALIVDPYDPVVHGLGYALCLKLDQCSESELGRRAATWTDAEPGNAIAWAARARSELAAGDQVAAESSLQRASVSQQANSHFIDIAARTEAALFGAGIPFPDSAVIAIGLAATLPTLHLVEFCREKSVEQPLVRAHCVNYYAILADRGKTALLQSIGLSLQIELLTSASESGGRRTDLVRRRAAIRETLDPADTNTISRQVWMMSSRQNFYDYVETFRSKNELAALASVDAALARKRASPGKRKSPANCSDEFATGTN